MEKVFLYSKYVKRNFGLITVPGRLSDYIINTQKSSILIYLDP